ncbi:hypothetical protein ACK3TF_003021 [Chlorella vulgaris]
MVSEMADPAWLLTRLSAVSTTKIDEMDYGRLMAAYSHLTPAAWQPTSLRRASPLVHHCLPDLRNAAQKVLFPQLKRGLPAANLAVRQEHLTLPRKLVLAFPATYTALRLLTD